MKLKIEGTSPLLMHNPRLVNPADPIVREMKALTSKRKKTDDDLTKIGMLEWFGGLYTDGDEIVYPTANFRKAFIEAARISKLGKQVERAVSLNGVAVPLKYAGPATPQELWEDGGYISELPVVVMRSRVTRTRPQFDEWAVELDGTLLEDAGLNGDEFERIADLAGRAIGVGDNRTNGYGRFTAEVTL